MSRNKFTLRLLSIAEQDSLDLIEYVAAENLSAAHHLADQIEQGIQRLQQHPFIGKVPADPKLARMGYRVLIVDNHLVFYKVREKTVLVYRIIHGARDILPLLEDL